MPTSPVQEGTTLVFGTDGRLKVSGFLVQTASLENAPDVLVKTKDGNGKTVNVTMAGFDQRWTCEFVPEDGTTLLEPGDVVSNGATAHSGEKFLVESAGAAYTNEGIMRQPVTLGQYEGVTLS